MNDRDQNELNKLSTGGIISWRIICHQKWREKFWRNKGIKGERGKETLNSYLKGLLSEAIKESE